MTEHERRYVCRLIDSAVERCEEGNLRDRLDVPRWVADLVVHLQAAADEDLRIPRDTIAAHGQLLDLRERYMRAAWHRPEVGFRSPCHSCGKPMSPLCRRTRARSAVAFSGSRLGSPGLWRHERGPRAGHPSTGGGA